MIGDNFDLLNLVKDTKIKSRKLEFDLKVDYDENRITVCYDTGPGRLKPRPVTFNRYVRIENKMLNIFGLIQAESTKADSFNAFDFNNSDPYLVKLFSEYFQRFWGIDKDLLKLEVTYWKGKLDDVLKSQIKEFWSAYLGLSTDRINVRQGSEYRLTPSSIAKHGVASLRMNSRALKVIVMRLLDMVRRLAEEDADIAVPYMQGLMSGDGTFSTIKNGSLSYLGIAFNPASNEASHYANMLKILGVEFSRSAFGKPGRRLIGITGWWNMIRILRMTNGRIFLQKEKNRLFINSLLRNQYLRSLVRVEKLPVSGISATGYSETFGCGMRSSYKSLNRLERLGLLSKIETARHNKNIYEITPEGDSFLIFLDSLRNNTG